MRKLFALLLVAGTFAFAACEQKKSEEANTETVDSTSVVEEAPAVDTTAAPATDATTPTITETTTTTTTGGH